MSKNFKNDYLKFFIWLLLSAFVYHALAGFRHLLMDCHWGESKRLATLTAGLCIGLSVLFALAFGVMAWA